MERVKPKITLEADGEELRFIKFLNSLLPQKPDLDKVAKTAVEEASALLPFDLLAACVEHENGVGLAMFHAPGLPEAFVASARDGVLKEKNVAFPLWKEKLVDELTIKLFPEKAGAGPAADGAQSYSSVLLHKIEGVPNGFVQVFSGGRDIYNERHEFVLGLLTYWLVSYFALARIYERLESLAVTDPLTGVFNRRKFEQELEREIERAKRYRLDFTVIMLDVDDLKGINDAYGHWAGDLTLRKSAKILSCNLRKVDVVTRIGGDEFVLILPHTGAEGAKVVAERLLEKFGTETVDTGGEKLPLHVTMSLTSFYPDDTFDSLYRRVDAGLNEAKKSCKGSYYIIQKMYL